jgi:hypothetical protein
MPIVLPDLSGISQGIQGAGESIAQGLERRAQRRLQDRRRGALDQILSQADLKSPEGQKDFLRTAISAGMPTKDALGILGSAMKQQEVGLKFAKEQRKQDVLSSVLGGGTPIDPRVPERMIPEQAPASGEAPVPGQAPAPDRVASQESLTEKFQPKEITEQEIAALSTVDPSTANILQRQKDAASKVSEKMKDREFKVASKVLERADQQSEELAQKEVSLGLMIDAINKGNLGFFTPDNIAELTGIEGLRSPEGAQFIASGKEFFLGSLRRAGPRPNQWIEQQIQKMLPQIGRSKEANLVVAESLKTSNAIERKRVELVDEIASEQEKEFGFVRRNLGREVDKRLKVFAEEEQKKLESNLRDIVGDQKRVKVPEGTKMSAERARFYLDKADGNKKKAIKMAEMDGYDISVGG